MSSAKSQDVIAKSQDVIGVILLCAYVVSFSAFGWLIWRNARMPSLFDRQVLHLSVAGTLYILVPNTFLIVCSSVDVPKCCDWYIGMVHFFEIVSALIELHIAVGLAAAMYKHVKFRRLLRRGLPLVWFLGGVIAVADVRSSTIEVDNFVALTHCGNRSPVHAVCLTACFVVCLCTYVVSLFRSCAAAGETTMLRSAERAVCFPLAFFVTYGPLVVYNLTKEDRKWNRIISDVAFVLVNLNGFATACVCRALHMSRLRGFPVTFILTSTVEPGSIARCSHEGQSPGVSILRPTPGTLDKPSIPW